MCVIVRSTPGTLEMCPGTRSAIASCVVDAPGDRHQIDVAGAGIHLLDPRQVRDLLRRFRESGLPRRR